MLDLAGLRRMAVARQLLGRSVSGLHRRRAKAAAGASGLASQTVTREVDVRVVAPAGMPRHVPVVLRYDIADPYAIYASLPAAPGQDVTWVFARDLMSHGLQAPTGEGDVRVWPARTGGNGVRIALISPDGEALVQAAVSDVDDFLRESYLLCPPGRESDHLDVDGALRLLLAS